MEGCMQVVEKCRRAGGLTKSATSQALIQGSELSHRHLTYLQPARVCKGAGLADPKLQDFHDTGQRQGIQEESSEDPVGPTVEQKLEAFLEPDQ